MTESQSLCKFGQDVAKKVLLNNMGKSSSFQAQKVFSIAWEPRHGEDAEPEGQWTWAVLPGACIGLQVMENTSRQNILEFLRLVTEQIARMPNDQLAEAADAGERFNPVAEMFAEFRSRLKKAESMAAASEDVPF